MNPRDFSGLLRIVVWCICLVLLVGTSAFAFSRRGLDSQWQDYGGGWSYIWYQTGDYERWAYNGSLKLGYTWNDQKWYDMKVSTWYGLTSTGFASDFVGDGTFHDLGNGWFYRYHTTYNCGYWNVGGANNYRFAYTYTRGQWLDYGTTWSALTTGGGYSIGFIGDGAFHDLGNGWFYRYHTNYNCGYWNVGSANNHRFAYTYTRGQWLDYGTTWSALTGGGYSNAFVGDGAFHDLGNRWYFMYHTTYNCGYWNAGSANNYRFAYAYTRSQWLDYGTTWSALTGGGYSNAFIGDGAYRVLDNGWSYKYDVALDRSFWEIGTSVRFRYDYDKGQWWDILPHLGQWGRLGSGGICQAFIADGKYHYFNDTDWFHYRPDTDTYKWGSGATTNGYFYYSFTDKSWYEYNGNSWIACKSYDKFDVRYIGTHRFVRSYFHDDWGVGAPAGYKDISYWCYAVDSAGYRKLLAAKWAINNPNYLGIWQGGDLNVLFCNTTNGGAPDANMGWAEYTIKDTIVFKEDMEWSGFDKMVGWLGIVRDYYGKQIRTVAFQAHGSSYAWAIGEVITTRNYSTDAHKALFLQWAKYMTEDGQILSYHCNSGQATRMLNDIANWTGCDIFAHSVAVHYEWWWVDSTKPQVEPSAEGPDDKRYHWNNNILAIRLDPKYPDSLVFQYKSSPTATPRELFWFGFP